MLGLTPTQVLLLAPSEITLTDELVSKGVGNNTNSTGVISSALRNNTSINVTFRTCLDQCGVPIMSGLTPIQVLLLTPSGLIIIDGVTSKGASNNIS